MALSSGEAEFIALTTGVTEGEFVRVILEELTGEQFEHRVYTDSTACRGMAMRKGCGRVRHLDIKLLFVQDLVAAKRVRIEKVNTLDNLADLNTKAHPPTRHWTLMRMMGFTLPAAEGPENMNMIYDDEE